MLRALRGEMGRVAGMSEVARMQLRLPYTAQDEDRHGKTRTYCRFRGRKKRLPDPTDPAFLSAYQSALEELKAPNAASDGSKARRVFAGTFEWLGRAYMCSVEFRQLDARSQRTRMNVLERCFAEPHRKGSGTRLGDCPLSSFGPIQLKVLRDRKAELPGAANNRLKYISAMYAWAIENHHATSNPTR